MSQIGNYIHRTFKGYLEEGITENGAFSDWKQDIYENILPPSVPEGVLRQRESMLNEYINANKIKGSTQQQQAVWEYLDQYLQSELDIAGREVASVTSKRGGSVAVSLPNDDEFNKLKDRFKALDMSYQEFLATKEENNVLSDLNQLATDIEAYAIQNNKFKPKIVNRNSYVELRDAINTYLSQPSYSMLKGKLGEALAVLLDDGIELTAEMSCNDMVKQLESKRAKVQTGQKTVKRHIGKKTIYNAAGTDVTLNYESQSKADLRLTFGGQNNVGINVKNYYLGQESAIHVHGGGQLTYLFKDNPDFLNHFINLFVNHSGIGAVDFTTKKMQMVQDFSANALAYALAGKEKQEKSSIFMVIGRGAGTNHSTAVKLFSVRDLFEILQKQQFKGVAVTVGGQEVTLGARLFTQPLDAKNKKTRLTAVIEDARSKVLSVSVLSSALGF